MVSWLDGSKMFAGRVAGRKVPFASFVNPAPAPGHGRLSAKIGPSELRQPPHSPTPGRVLTVSDAAGAEAISLQSVSSDDLILGEDAVAQGAIKEDLIRRNLAPKRYDWKNKGEEILAKILRASAAMGNQMEKPS